MTKNGEDTLTKDSQIRSWTCFQTSTSFVPLSCVTDTLMSVVARMRTSAGLEVTAVGATMAGVTMAEVDGSEDMVW